MNSGSKQFSSARLSYIFPDPNNAVQMEVFQTKDSLRGYLFVQATPIPAYREDPTKASIKLIIEDILFSYITVRHEGGHKLLLPEEGLLLILETLSKGLEVQVELSGYRTTISPLGFESCYKKFQKPSKFSKFIQLPF